MHRLAHASEHEPRSAAEPGGHDAIMRAIETAGHYLPAQGPIGVFVHHNTLHAFEDEPFEDAVVHAARVYGTEPFLTETRYREELARGRILPVDIDAVLAADAAGDADQVVAGGRVSLRELHRALLLHAVRQEDDAAVRWTLTESHAVDRLRHDLSADARARLLGQPGPGLGAADGGAEQRAANELWQACIEAVSLARPTIVHVLPPVRHRDLILAADPSLDTDAVVHPLLIRICAAFLDQGVASWPMPGREAGLLAAAVRLYGGRGGPTEPWNAGLPAALRAVAGKPAVAVIEGELDRLGVPENEREDFIIRSLLALRGWAGIIRHLEERPDRAPVVAVPSRLVDFLALRLVCDRVAAAWAATRLGFRSGPQHERLGSLWTELRDRFPPRRGPGTVARAFLLHQVSQLVGLTGDEIRDLDENELLRLERAVAAFDDITRRRLFHLAYERRHRISMLDALAAHQRSAGPPAAARPTAQIVACIDERCESFRRHLEELGPGLETFGTAGFFAVPMYYRGVDDWHAAALCPIVIRPRHTVVERPLEEAERLHARRQRLRREVGRIVGGVSMGSRTLLRGGLFTALGGALAAVPLVARVVFPRLSARLGQRAAELAARRVPTRLDLEATGTAALPDGTTAGFDLGEMAAMVRRVLEDIGLRARFARIVAVIGHGSSSLNNPHESAYDCGACGGGRGGPNARAFALMANDPRIRDLLAAGGISIPADTVFVGGMLDTCADRVQWFDVDRVPADHALDFTALEAACERACTANAHERCRRFESAPLDISPAEARLHVESRSVDLAQVRPELGHATNAMCIIGRRWKTRGLFLDRRAFLVSYDPESDADGAILTRTLAAVGPVGAGINLEYYFSIVDRLGYGAGTKLPHNITGLLGVMDGQASDLRTGLPWQMVEIHEPVRLLVVIEAPPDRILAAARSLPAVERLVVNRWIQLVAWDPGSDRLFVFEQGGFQPYEPGESELPIVDTSAAWYTGLRDHLPPARIRAGLAGSAGATGTGGWA